MYEARGKEVHISEYAVIKLRDRGVAYHEVVRVIEDGAYYASERLGRLWIAHRTVIVYYEERESYIYVRNVGVTRRKL